ncbi:MAG: transposase [Chloroflexi bacterium]|nr:transposase [Chloroflexota bacterium]
MSILGHTSKVVFGWAVAGRANTDLALQAWTRAKATFQHYNIAFRDLIMHHDQDSVYTSYAWTGQLLQRDHVRLSYALNGAKDNPEMESFNGHFKSENLSLFLEVTMLDQLQSLVSERIDYYNNVRRHSTLAYLAPFDFLQRHQGDTMRAEWEGGRKTSSCTDPDLIS